MLHSMTESMKRFQAGAQDWYESADGFRHTLNRAHMRMTTQCMCCFANRNDKYSEVQTMDSEFIAVEVAHWQMNHREKCRVPAGALLIR